MKDEVITKAREILGLFLKDARKERGFTQQQLADMVGVNHMTISKIESGKFNFGIDIFNKLSIALGFKLELIMNYNENHDNRFDLIQNGRECLVTDFSTGIRIAFNAGNFNGSQRIITPENSVEILASDLATVMKLMGEWVFKEYPELI